MLEKWKSLPICAQWSLYIPGVVSIPLLSCWLINAAFAGGMIPKPFANIITLIHSLILYALFTIFFIRTSLALAPRKKLLTSFITFLSFTAINLIGSVMIFFFWVSNSRNFTSNLLIIIFLFLTWVFVGIAALRHEKNSEDIKGTRRG